MSKAIPVAIPVNNFNAFMEELPESHKRQINEHIKQEKAKMLKYIKKYRLDKYVTICGLLSNLDDF